MEPLLLTAREAARALSCSERTLWGLTVPRGPIPSIKIGTRGVRYSREALVRWIASCESAGVPPVASEVLIESREECAA